MISKGLTKNIFSVVSTRFVLKGINFISLYILLRYLDPKELGEYGLFISTLILATTLGNLGVRNSSARSIGSEGNYSLNITCISVVFPLLMLISLVTMFAVLYFSGFILDTPINIASIALGVVCHLLIILRQGVCLGMGDIRLFNMLEVVPRLVLLAIILIAVNTVESFGDNFAIHALVSGYMIATLLVIWRTKFKISKNIKNHLFKLIKTGFVYCVALSLILLNSYIPIYMTNILQDTTETGQIFAALRINDIFLEFASAAGLVLFSHATRSNEPSDIKRVFKTFFWVVITSIIGCIFIQFYATELIELVSGNKYKAAALNLSIISFGLPFVAFNRMAYGLISGKGHPSAGVVVYTIVILVNLSVTVYLYLQNIENFVVYSLVVSQIVASLLFLTVIFGFNRRRIL